MPPSAANFTYAAFYGEPYLRRLHQEGYPVNEYLKRNFSTRFYDDNNLTQAERSRASNFVASLTQSIRLHRTPGWVRRNPELAEMYKDVLADYDLKFQKQHRDSDSHIYKFIDQAVQNSFNDSMTDDADSSLISRITKDGADATFSTKIIKDEKFGADLLHQRMQQLEKERDEKEAIIQELKKKYDAEQEKLAEAMRIASLKQEKAIRMEEELKTAKMEVTMIKEKIELKDQLLSDKERTIQILSHAK